MVSAPHPQVAVHGVYSEFVGVIMGKWCNKGDEEPNMDVETCHMCDGDSDPLDDLFYCDTCQGRGWVYAQSYNSPYLTMGQIEEWHKEWMELNHDH